MVVLAPMPRATDNPAKMANPGFFPQCAGAEPHVREKLLEPNETPHSPCFFLDSGHVAKFAQCRSSGFVRRHPALNVLLRLYCYVVADVLIEIPDHALAAPHDLPSCPTGRRIRAIAPASLLPPARLRLPVGAGLWPSINGRTWRGGCFRKCLLWRKSILVL